MTSILGRKRNTLAVAAALTVLLPAAWGKGLDDFTLVKAIPADAFLAIHARDHAGLEFLNKQVVRVFAEIEKQRFDRDVKKLVKAMLREGQPPGTELEGFEERWQRLYDLWTSVEWTTMGQREFAMGMKLGFPTVEFVMLFMPPEDKLEEDFAGLSGLAKAAAALAPETFQLTTEETADAVIHQITIVAAQPPMAFCLGRRGSVLLFGFGPTMMEQSLALLRDEGGEPLGQTQRFKDAFGKLPPPTDELVFFDVAKLIGQGRVWIGNIMGMVAAGGPPEGEPGYEEFQQWQVLPGKLIDALDMFEYVAAVTTTDGMRTTENSITVLRDDAKSRALYPVVFGNKPLRDPLKYVPKEAGDFWVTSGFDVPALYKVAMKIIREDVPNGEVWAQQIDEFKLDLGALAQAAPGMGMPQTGEEEAAEPNEMEPNEAAPPKKSTPLGIEEDIIGWIQGGLAKFSVPGPTPYSPSEFVFMLGVRDEAKAQRLLDELMSFVEPKLAQQSGSVVDAEIEGAEGFKSVVFPMLAMFGLNKPTLGVKDGWLFFGSSPDIIATTLKVGAGKADNFAKNERFQKEGVLPEGSVTSLSFTDLTGLGESLGQKLQMVPMIGMFVPNVMKNPVAQSVLTMVGKVGRVVRKLDFFQSSASRTTFDGKTMTTKMITTYREPPVIEKPKPPTTEGEAQAEKSEVEESEAEEE